MITFWTTYSSCKHRPQGNDQEFLKKCIYKDIQYSAIDKQKNSMSNKWGQHFGNVNTRHSLKTQVVEEY